MKEAPRVSRLRVSSVVLNMFASLAAAASARDRRRPSKHGASEHSAPFRRKLTQRRKPRSSSVKRRLPSWAHLPTTGWHWRRRALGLRMLSREESRQRAVRKLALCLPWRSSTRARDDSAMFRTSIFSKLFAQPRRRLLSVFGLTLLVAIVFFLFSAKGGAVSSQVQALLGKKSVPLEQFPAEIA